MVAMSSWFAAQIALFFPPACILPVSPAEGIRRSLGNPRAAKVSQQSDFSVQLLPYYKYPKLSREKSWQNKGKQNKQGKARFPAKFQESFFFFFFQQKHWSTR